jgi:tyrosine-protein phosphatase YwqE
MVQRYKKTYAKTMHRFEKNHNSLLENNEVQVPPKVKATFFVSLTKFDL